MKKRLLSLAMIGVMTLSLAGCANSTQEKTSKNPSEKQSEDNYLYNISACLSEDNTYNNYLLNGFSDALTDYLGSEHIKISKKAVSTTKDSAKVASAAVASNPDMIFTTGKPMLLSVSNATSEIPIVATGIVDFKGALRIPSSGNSSWDKTTGTNITGVSCKPSISDQLSLMIEATDKLQNVGILFSPEDTDSIYQNEIFESYLDEAGIAWKEYSLTATDVAITENTTEENAILPPDKFVAANAKAGMDNSVISLGKSIIAGINSADSTRTAKISKNWKHPKIDLPTASTISKTKSDNQPEASRTENQNISTKAASDNNTRNDIQKNESETSENNQNDATENESATSVNSQNAATENESVTSENSQNAALKSEPVTSETIKTICKECSAIYIPYNSILTDQIEQICSIATEAGVVTVGGDTEIGQYTLVSLFSDPYDIGYSAGKKAVGILNGGDITSTKISNSSTDTIVKLYNSEVAQQFNKEFPKSFQEINEFLDTYEYGSKTKRHSSEEE